MGNILLSSICVAAIRPKCGCRLFGLPYGAGAFLFSVLDLLFCSLRLVLAEKCLAEVGQVVGQGAPQRHAFDFVEAAYGQRRQPAIGS